MLTPTTGATSRPSRTRPPLIAALLMSAVLLVALLFNQSAVHWRDNASDSHYYAYCGWRVAEGARPYLDVWDNKPPGIWWLNALGYWACGPGRGRELLICSAAVAAGIWGLVAAAQTLYQRSLWPVALAVGCVLLTHLRYECGANRTETFVAPCELLAIWGYLRWRRDGRLRWLWLAGLFAGAAPLFKQSGLAALGAGALTLLLTQILERARGAGAPARWWQPWLVAGAAAAIPAAVAGAVLASCGGLGEAWFAVVGFNRAYFQAHDATLLRVRDALALFWPELRPLAGLYLLAGLGALLGLLRLAEKRALHETGAGLSTGVGVVWLWLLGALYLACVGPGRLSYHLAPTLAPLGLLALYPLHWLLGGHDLVGRLVARPSLTLVLAAYLYVLGALGRDSVTLARGCWSRKPGWYSLRSDPPAAYEVQAAEIQRLTRPDETVYVWGWSPGTYRFAYRRCPSRFATLEKLSHVGQAAVFIRDQAIADIRRAPPALFVISTGDLEALLAAPRSPFAEWLAAEYRELGDFQGMQILQRRRRPQGRQHGRARADTSARGQSATARLSSNAAGPRAGGGGFRAASGAWRGTGGV